VNETLFPLVFVLFAAIAIAVAVYSYRAKLERRRNLSALALNQGLDFSVQDHFATLDEPFSLFLRGDGRGVENVLWGVWNGLELRAFDYWYYEESTDSNGHTSRSYARFDCALMLVDVLCPRLEIAEENLLTRLADAMTFRDIAFESEEFNRRFNVRSDDVRFASALVDARMMAWLLGHGDGYAFELVGDRLLCWCRRVAPAEIVLLMGTAQAFRGQIPDVVKSLYPNR
jgi:hypothetical protein